MALIAWGPLTAGIDRTMGQITDSPLIWDLVDGDLGPGGEVLPRPDAAGSDMDAGVQATLVRDGVRYYICYPVVGALANQLNPTLPPGCTTAEVLSAVWLGNTACALIRHAFTGGTMTRVHCWDGSAVTYVEDPASFDWINPTYAGEAACPATDAAAVRSSPRCMTVSASCLWLDDGIGNVRKSKTGNPRAWDLHSPSEVELLGEFHVYEAVVAGNSASIQTRIPTADVLLNLTPLSALNPANITSRFVAMTVDMAHGTTWLPVDGMGAFLIYDQNGGVGTNLSANASGSATLTDVSGFIRIDLTALPYTGAMFRFRVTLYTVSALDVITPPVPTCAAGVPSLAAITTATISGQAFTTAAHTFNAVNPSILLTFHVVVNRIGGAPYPWRAPTVGPTVGLVPYDNTTFGIPPIDALVRGGAFLYPVALWIDGAGNAAQTIHIVTDPLWLATKRAQWAKSAGAGDAGWFPVAAGESGGNSITALIAWKNRLLVGFQASTALLTISPDPAEVRLVDWSKFGCAADSGAVQPIAISLGMACLPAPGGYQTLDLTQDPSQLPALDFTRELGRRLQDLARPTTCVAMTWWPATETFLIAQLAADATHLEIIALSSHPANKVIGWTRWSTTETYHAGRHYWFAVVGTTVDLLCSIPGSAARNVRWDASSRTASWTFTSTCRRLGDGRMWKRVQTVAAEGTDGGSVAVSLIPKPNATPLSVGTVPTSTSTGPRFRCPFTTQLFGIQMISTTTLRRIEFDAQAPQAQ